MLSMLGAVLGICSLGVMIFLMWSFVRAIRTAGHQQIAGGFGGVEWSQGPILRLSEWETLRSALPEASGIFSAGETLEASSGSDVLLLCIGLNILQTAPKVILRLLCYDDWYCGNNRHITAYRYFISISCPKFLVHLASPEERLPLTWWAHDCSGLQQKTHSNALDSLDAVNLLHGLGQGDEVMMGTGRKWRKWTFEETDLPRNVPKTRVCCSKPETPGNLRQ